MGPKAGPWDPVLRDPLRGRGKAALSPLGASQPRVLSSKESSAPETEPGGLAPATAPGGASGPRAPAPAPAPAPLLPGPGLGSRRSSPAARAWRLHAVYLCLLKRLLKALL